MLDIANTKAGLELLSSAVAAVKSLIGLANTATDVEIKRQTSEALEKIYEAKQKYFELQESYFDLARQNRELKDEIEKTKAYVFHHSVSWRKMEDKTEEGPFCPICLADKCELRLQFVGLVNDGDILFDCPKAHRRTANEAQPTYKLPRSLIERDRYVEWS